MYKVSAILLGMMMLCAFGEPPPLDASALPEAWAARERLLTLCQSKAATFKTDHARVECGLAAYRAYAVTEKLRDMRLFKVYADTVLRVSAQVDAGRIDQAEAYRQSSEARTRYQFQVEKQYADWKAVQPRNGPLFDRVALPAATTARDRAVKACALWSDVKSMEPRTKCTLDAETAFTAAIRLQDMDLFYGYASVLRVATIDAADGKRPVSSLDNFHQTAWSNFLLTLERDYSAWQSKRSN